MSKDAAARFMPPHLPAPSPTDVREAGRLEALDALDILDTPPEERFEAVARIIRNVFDVEIAIVSVIDAHRQWYKTCHGFDADEIDRSDSFCNLTIQRTEPLIVPDTLDDVRFATHHFVLDEPHIRFYAGIPLRTRSGYNIGTLCAVDKIPRAFTDREVDVLRDLSTIVMDQLELRQNATVDPLTHTLSRRGFHEEAKRSFALARRHGHDLACITLDLDHFKSINDTHGHPAGDVVLREIARICIANLRETDYVGRMGGEEFAILLPYTDTAGAIEVAEKIRTSIEAHTIHIGDMTLHATASLGIAVTDAGTTQLDDLLSNSDLALYKAKGAGRNRTAVAERSSSGPGPRRRVLKAGQIQADNRMSPMDCTVRSLGDSGAGIDLSNSIDLPERFTLQIRSDRFAAECRIVSQTERHVEVEFQ